MKDEILNDERNLVRKLRYEDKLKYKEIAEKLNRSLYWVHCRLHDKYKPSATRVEKYFQDNEVTNYLETHGHVILRSDTRTKCDEFSQEVDILSLKDGMLYVNEVKNIVNHHQLQTAIGQMILHKYAYKNYNKNKVIYQIIFPEIYKNYSYFSASFLDHLEKELEINIVFI